MAQNSSGKQFTEEEVDNDFFLSYINKKRRNVVKKMKQIVFLEEQDPENLKPKQRVKLNNKAQVQQQIESFDSMRLFYGQAWEKSGKDTENNTQQPQQTVKTVVQEKVVEVVVKTPPNYSTVARVCLMLSYLGQVKSQKVKDLGQGVLDLGENQVVSERLDEMTEELVEILKMGPEQLHSLTEFFTANELLTQNGSDLVRVPAPEVVETPEVVLQEQEEEEPVVAKKQQSSFDSDSVDEVVEKEETPVVQEDAQEGNGDAVDANEGMEMTVEKGEKWADMDNSDGSDGEGEGKKSEGSEKNFEVRDDSNIEQVKKSKRTVQEAPKEDDVDEDGFKLVRKKPGKQTNNRGGNRKYGKQNYRGKYGGNGNRNYKNRGNYRRRYNNKEGGDDNDHKNREDRVYQKNDKNNHYYKGDRGQDRSYNRDDNRDNNRRQDRNRNYNDRDDYKNTRGNRDNNRRNYKNRRYEDREEKRDNSQEKKE